ncbi:MAG: starch-binding protein [Bacteroidetes bacterium]|nr:starch-binding protein [Bacteroidota bacterium]
MQLKRLLVPAFLLAAILTAHAQTDFREETIYFLMTTRFYDGDPTNNRPTEWCSYDPTNPGRQITDPNDVTWRGDFKGLIDKLDFIKNMGFTAIWITPVVQNRGPLDYHGYHAWDFTKVDPRYESEGVTFKTLLDSVHAKGMKLVLDVVTNHSGRFGIKGQAEIKYNTDPNQPWGKDKNGNTLQDNPNWEYDGLTPNPDDNKIWSRANLAKMPSPYNANLAAHNWPSKESYVDTSDPIWYHHSGNGFAQGYDDTENLYNRALAGDTPDLNTESQAVRDYLVAAYKTFIDMGVDAFRWDTIKHMDRASVLYFLDEWKKINPDLFVFGEVAQKRHELHPVEEINPHWYTWRGAPGSSANSGMAVIDFYAQATFHNVFEEGGAFSGVKSAARYDHLYADPSTNMLWLDNHDFGPNNDWNRRYGGSAENLAAAMNFMFTWRGIPIIYYGTEMQFMKGAYADIHESADIEKSLDRTGRAYYGTAMNNAPTNKLYKHLKKLNDMRKAIPALQKGSWTWAGGDHGNGVGYVRESGDSYVAVGLAKDGPVTFTFTGLKKNGTYRDAVTGHEIEVTGGTLSFKVSPSSAGIYVHNGPGRIGELGTGFFQSSSDGGGGGNPGGKVTVSPDPVKAGQPVTITYDGFLNDNTVVNLYWSFNSWTGTTTTSPMTKKQDGTWTVTVNVPQTATGTLDFVFNNGSGTWDNNSNQDWHYTITGGGGGSNLTVHFYKPEDWSGVKIHFWNVANATSTWPGVDMVSEGENWYKHTFTGATSASIVFNDGAGKQTADLTRSGSEGWFYNGAWYDSKPDTGGPQDPDMDIYLYKPADWAGVKIYFWNVSSGATTTWPGVDMTSIGNNWYKYTFTGANSASIVFNDGAGKQSSDLSRSGSDGWYYNGAWYNSLGDTPVSVDEEPQTAFKPELYENYPNPFNPSTVVSFWLPQGGYARLTIFNALGQEITVLADGLFQAGMVTRRFDARGLSSGLYVVRLETQGTIQSRRMIFNK